MVTTSYWWHKVLVVFDSVLYRLVRLTALFIVFPIFNIVDEEFTRVHASKIMLLLAVRLIVFSAQAWFYIRPYNLTDMYESNYTTYSKIIFLVDFALLFVVANMIMLNTAAWANIIFAFGLVFLLLCFYKRPSVRKLLFLAR